MNFKVLFINLLITRHAKIRDKTCFLQSVFHKEIEGIELYEDEMLGKPKLLKFLQTLTAVPNRDSRSC